MVRAGRGAIQAVNLDRGSDRQVWSLVCFARSWSCESRGGPYFGGRELLALSEPLLKLDQRKWGARSKFHCALSSCVEVRLEGIVAIANRGTDAIYVRRIVPGW